MMVAAFPLASVLLPGGCNIGFEKYMQCTPFRCAKLEVHHILILTPAHLSVSMRVHFTKSSTLEIVLLLDIKSAVISFSSTALQAC